MLTWIAENGGTIIVCVILAVIAAAIVWKLIRDKKAGKSSCGGNCSHCAGGCAACRAPYNQKNK